VQSVATKLVVEREDLINAFDAKEYWTVQAQLKATGEKLKAEFDIKLHKVDTSLMVDEEDENQSEDDSDEGETLKLGNGRFDKLTVDQVFSQLGINTPALAKGKGDVAILSSTVVVDFNLTDIQKKKTSGNPGIPFITSSLQQTASRMFGRPVKTVMQAAQKLYEQ